MEQPNPFERGRGIPAVMRGLRRAGAILVFRAPAVTLAVFLALGIAANVTGRFSEAGFEGNALGGPDVEEIFIDVPLEDDFSDDGTTVDAFPTLVLPDSQEESDITEVFFTADDYSTVAALPAFYAPGAWHSQHSGNVRQYVVEQGDTLSGIAAQFGVSSATILTANNLGNADYLRPGQVLRFPRVSGVLYTVKKNDTVRGIAQRFNGNADEIIAFNLLPADGTINVGEELVIPGGKAPAPPAPVRRVYAGRVSPTSNLSAVDGFFIPPTVGRRMRGITAYHRGVDIANACGTPIYAAASGTITRADGVGWNGGFGQVTVIHHPNGVDTLYAHQSRIMVAAGQAVAQGELLGLMGTTGRSTGCHLHFEVHGARNPF